MSDFNKTILLGRLTRDPELRYAQSGTAITKFGMASNHVRGSGDEKKETVCFVDCVSFGRTAENIEKYMKKGNLFMIEGRLDFQRWEDKETGGKRSKHVIIVERFTFLPNGERSTAQAETTAPVDYDDLPF